MARKVVSAQFLNEFLKKTGGFFNVMNKSKIVKAENGTLIGEMTVEKEHVNQFGTLHGGLSATLIDTYTCCAVLTDEKHGGDYGSSVELHIKYFKPAKIGDELIIEAKTERAGKYLGYLNCEIRNKKTGDVVSKGTQTVFMVRSKDKN